LIAAAVPIVTLNIGLRGVMEAYQEFRTIAAVNVLMGVVTFGGPVVALALSPSASAMIFALVAARTLGALAYGFAVWRKLSGSSGAAASRESARALLRFGSWVTLSNIVGPVMEYMDRFIVGAMLTMTAVAYYATPFDVVSRLGTVAAALAGVLFPAFTTALASNPDRASVLYATSIRHVLLALTVPVLVLVTFAKEGLYFWLGATFAEHSEPVVQWLAVAFLINAVARMPYALLQASGRPDVTAKLHLMEVPVFLGMVWWLVSIWGIAGAAAAWCLRVVLDTALLLYLGGRLAPIPWGPLPAVLRAGVFIVALAAGAAWLEGVANKIMYFVMAVAVFSYIARRWLLEAGEVARLLGHFRTKQG